MTTPRRLILLTDGYGDDHTAKTAINLIRYKREEVVAVLDRRGVGRTSRELLGLGDVPVVGSIAEAPGANTLVIGIAPPGGKIPPPWRAVVLEAIHRGLNIVSGLHDLLRDDAEFVQAARQRGVELVDVRMNDEHDVANRKGIREGCLRIQTVGNDCSLGKMVTSVEVVEGLKRAGVDAKFVATGQTGILIEGDGIPIDRVISDFVNGAAEKLVLANQHHEVIVIEGQGSLFHPRYSCVTFGLLHGAIPDGLILCYEMGRKTIYGMPEFPLPPLEQVRAFYEASANIMHPCRSIGIAVNTSKFSEDEALAECERVSKEMGLPVCDVIRHGPEPLVEAVLKLKRKLGK
ncbi:MAG: DUF1611 domain-containing protein [Pirellulales bacterium]|nr:DUF1611 domain-containing protein [Pirellulales bacterium]